MKNNLRNASFLIMIILLFSCGKSPKELISGKWIPTRGKGQMEFTKDGSLIITQDSNLVSAKYKFVDDDQVFIEYSKEKPAEQVSVSFYNNNKNMITKDESNTKVQRFLRVDNLSYHSFGNFHDDLLKVSRDNKYGFIDTSGTERIKPIYDYSEDFDNGLAKVKLRDHFGYIDTSGAEIVPISYDKINLVFEDTISDNRVMEFIYGNFDGEESKWIADKNQHGKDVIKFANGKAMYAKILLKENIGSHDIPVLIYVIGSNTAGNKYHFSGNLISAYIFEKYDNKWFMTSRSDFIGIFGGWGEPPNVSVTHVGEKKIGLIFESGWTQMGTFQMNYNIYIPFKNEFKEAISFISHEEFDNGLDPRWEYDATYSLIPNKESDYYDLMIRTIGNEYDYSKKTLVNLDKKEMYKYVSGKYIKY